MGHYLLFLPDNYLGVDLENGLIRKIDCPGSIMTDAYELRYRELLTSEEWAGSVPCRDTLAEHLTGRSDWETLSAFYDGIRIPDAGRSDPGPSFLPLEITRLTSIDPLAMNTYEETNAALDEETDEDLDADLEPAPASAFPARYIDLRKGMRGPVTRFQEAQIYLIKSRAAIGEYKDDLTDDTLIFLGSTGNGDDRIKVRGAEKGDRICAVQFGDEASAGGCAIVNSRLTSLDLLDYPPEWRPAITVSPVTSRTVTISVSVPISGPLNVQLMPAYGPFTDTLSVRSPYTTMQVVALPDSLSPASADLSEKQAFDEENYVHTATLTLPYPAFEGHVRVWRPDAPPGQEAFAAYFLSPDFVPEESGFGPNNRGFGPNNRGFGPNNRGFGPNNRGFGPNNRGFGPNNRGFGPNNRGFGPNNRGFGPNNRGFGVNRAWGANQRSFDAPVASGDGKVTVFNVENVMGDSGIASMSSAPNVAGVPSWLRIVGPAYRLTNHADVEPAAGRTIAFQYLQREAPDGGEPTLAIYYSGDDGKTWMKLPTLLDQNDNFAAARMPDNDQHGQGLYALMATLEMPALQPGWNLIAYPLASSQPITDALASVLDDIEMVVAQDAGLGGGWRVYDQRLIGEDHRLQNLVNDLHIMEFGKTYWVHAKRAATPFLPIQEYQPLRDISLSTDDKISAPIASGQVLSQTEPALVGTPALPPAIFFGPLSLAQMGPGGEFGENVEGVRIEAVVDGNLCGTAEVIELAGSLIYKISVSAASGDRDCGWYGDQVIFLDANGQPLGEAKWDNRLSQCVELGNGGRETEDLPQLRCADIESP